MSIESNLASIATSLATIAALLSKTTIESNPEPAPAPVNPVFTPPAPVMPSPVPAPAAAPAAPLPFHDQLSLMTYVMTKYKELGPAKGGLIQGVLSEFGISHVSALPIDQYAAFYLKVEAL